MKTSRGSLIERSKSRCVQFASINVSSLAHRGSIGRGDGREVERKKDEHPDIGRVGKDGRGGREKEDGDGGDVISPGRGVTSRLPE